MSSLGSLHFVKRLASGGMGEVHLGFRLHAHNTFRILAIKKVNPHQVESKNHALMLQDEFSIASQLRHPNIVQVESLEYDDSALCLTMEYIEGMSLKHIIEKAHEKSLQLPPEICAYIAMQICLGLEYLHSQTDPVSGDNLKLIHRDISPHNILVSRTGEVKIIDFGIAKARRKLSATTVGTIKGKILYFPPEAVEGKPLSSSADIFSTGLILFELLTGQAFFDDDSDIKVLERIRQCSSRFDIPEMRPGVSQELNVIAMKALEKDPRKRYQTAREFASALQRYISQHSPQFDVFELPSFLQTHFSTDLQIARGHTADVYQAYQKTLREITDETKVVQISSTKPTSMKKAAGESYISFESDYSGNKDQTAHTQPPIASRDSSTAPPPRATGSRTLQLELNRKTYWSLTGIVTLLMTAYLALHYFLSEPSPTFEDISGLYDIRWESWSAQLRLHQRDDKLTGRIFGNNHAVRQCKGSRQESKITLECTFYKIETEKYFTDTYTGTIAVRDELILRGNFTNIENYVGTWNATPVH